MTARTIRLSRHDDVGQLRPGDVVASTASTDPTRRAGNKQRSVTVFRPELLEWFGNRAELAAWLRDLADSIDDS